ncbi:MAG: IreB family regulatory phosphoprotein [Bacilli bacterium]|nr:IreB family regulatory phosphoprotein [Bacilli bacterium]
MDKTISFKIDDVNSALILDTLKTVKSILEEKGYNPINQIVGFLISGDPGYITSYKDARKIMMSIDRSKALEILVKKALI